MSTRAALRDLVVQVLKAARTEALDNVVSPSVMPTKPGNMPVLYVQTPVEKKTSMGRSLPRFITSVTLVVVGRLTHASEEFVQAQLDALVDQVHAAILGSPDLGQIVQQYSEVETSALITGEATQPIGELVMHFHCELFQQYVPPPGDPLLTIDMQFERASNQAKLAEALISLPQT